MKEITTTLKYLKKFVLKNVVNIISCVFALFLFSRNTANSPQIVIFDVGQGDAILIQQNNFQILVDGGPDNTILFEISKYMDPRDKNIEILVLTHPHADHIKGLLYVLDEYEVGEIWINKVVYENSDYEYLLDMYGDKLREVALGDILRYKDMVINVLYPFCTNLNREAFCGPQDGNINNESIVLEVAIKGDVEKGKEVLLMGDAEKGVEKDLIERNLLKDIDILKAGHHCSNTASSECFLGIVKPTVAICSCGEGNKFGHPHDETLKNFFKLGVQHLTTKDEGNIVFTF